MTIKLKPNLNFDFSSIQDYIENKYINDFDGHTEIPIAKYPTTMEEFFAMAQIITMGFDWWAPIKLIIENVSVKVEHSVENEGDNQHCEIILQFTPDGYDPIYIRYTGVGDSYADAEWDDTFEYVIPKEVKVTKYFTTSKHHYDYI